MKPADNIEKLIRRFCIREKSSVKTSAEMDKRILDDALKALRKSKEGTSAIEPNVWRTIIKSRITKLAAVAVIILIAALSITFLDKSVATAYALEQTIEANRVMRYIHTKYFDSSHDDVAKECWLEFDQAGQLKNVRINWSEWGHGEIVVWNQNKTQIWHRRLNCLSTFNDEIYTSRINNMAEADDPKLMVEDLYEKQTKGEIEIEIDEPTAKAKPIIVTATGLGAYTKRFVLFVDQATKLVTAREWYQLEEGKYVYQGVMEYYDYNIPIDENMFNLDDEIPEDVRRIDARTADIGIAQENLTDKEVAVKVVRELFEALIAKDYVKTAQICGGISSPAEIQQDWGKLNVVRIVSIGEPGPPPKLSKVFPKMLCVPYTIEVERNGEKVIRERQNLVRPVIGRRERWVIH